MHLKIIIFSWKFNVPLIYSTTYILDIDNFDKFQYFVDYGKNKSERPTAMTLKIFYGEPPPTINKTDFFVTVKRQITKHTKGILLHIPNHNKKPTQKSYLF